MLQNKKLKRNATYAIVEVAEVALLIALCSPLIHIYYDTLLWNAVANTGGEALCHGLSFGT